MTVEIPVVDLQLALSDDAPEELLAAVRAAAEQIGIIQVVNHGVPQQLIDDFHQSAGRVLALPREEKEKLASPTGHPYRGWRQWPDDFGRLELERINIGQYDNAEDALAAGLTPEQATLFAHVNVWPEQEPGLRDAAFRYRDAATEVGRKVVALYAKVLGVPAATFPLGDDGFSTFVVNDYPTWTHADTPADASGDTPAPGEKLLLLEHADGSVVTVLHQEGDYAGLQGQRPDGTWLPVPIRPGALQVFTGSLLANWTEGRLRPGRHRVVAGGTVTRRSSGVFLFPSLDTVVEPLPPFADPDDSDFEPVSVWERASTNVQEYLKVFGRPDQVAAWREGRPYVAELAR
ncbi:2-oxoglutarate and iron-dependent oxygenase domain-containing protein [Actinacidiphila sp. ITFR-21]|uniref:2-oxoglutarate and iron-dependent oxygenase domain-containing protein n=1 Tax=Actinacidiphila sp. ITFR-21 TaxID=3075199 RepID=UPI00288B8D42|nr:2-oxoglutarate and iron-dependent oxygenase domain-containing protein [Streptomyces sp. ITFR-21]WNI16118.1 2-oxoglutarate and iron-dependent oxygenase domain-containing protein [Streptomyces sp. ITFR-21]